MRLGLRILFGFFVIAGLAAFFVLRIFMAEIKPSVQQVMEDMMVDSANVLAEVAADDLVNGHMHDGRFASEVDQYLRRPVNAKIWGLNKKSLDFRVYVTDAKGIVQYDSSHIADGMDYSQWRDVALTLRGQYGARSTREVREDEESSVLYVAAPVLRNGKVIGVLAVAKPVATVKAFVNKAELKILFSGFWLLALSVIVGIGVTFWVVSNVRRLRNYANEIEAGKKLPVPQLPGELGDLAQAMEAMRLRVEGQEYVEAYVRALTHELKSPLAAIRGAGELLEEDLPAADRHAFSEEVLAQTARLQALVDRLLELSKLEQRQKLVVAEKIHVTEFLNHYIDQTQQLRAFSQVQLRVTSDDTVIHAEPGLLTLALNNLVENACAFSAKNSTVDIVAKQGMLMVSDTGPGVPDYALPKLGERFFSTVRPDGVSKGSGLGLAIVRQIMALHSGSMTVENTHPGLRVSLKFSATAQP